LEGVYAFEIPDNGVGIVDIADTAIPMISPASFFFNASEPEVTHQASSNISFEDAYLKELYKRWCPQKETMDVS